MVNAEKTASLADLIHRRADDDTAVFLEDARSDRALTYARFAARVDEWVDEFDALQLPNGAAVVLAIRDPLAFAIVHLAAIASGRRSVPINPDLHDGEPARSAGLIGAPGLVVFGLDVDRSPVSGWSTASVTEDGAPKGIKPGSEPAGSAGKLSGGGAAVLFTSGSTGTPKGVELLEKQLLFVAGQVARNNELTSTDRGFNSLPLFHVNAEVVALLATLVAGATIVLDASFHRTGFWELLVSRRISWLNAVPAILAVLTRDGEPIPPTDLRFIRSASAPLPDAVREALSGIPLVLSWGMTEGASQITATPIGAGHPGSVGRPLGGDVEVRDAGGERLSTNEVGGLWIRGPGIVRRYLFDAAADRFDAAGWLDTGDVGSVDANGYVYLAGRSDDVINRGGEKVYPAEVEEVLLGDPRVLEAVVVARADDVLGSVPVAYVIPVDRGSDTEALLDELRSRCRYGLPKFKRPIEILVVPDLPRAPTGKVQRSKVRELAAR
ncbi:MAG TPA: AMP-binding protein [Galbitalea sp.]|nr:AMP-binding protein [Galbitalea sp.]